MRCLTSARFTMDAEVLRWSPIDSGDEDDVMPGQWTASQDPISGAILNEWVPGSKPKPGTPQSTVRTVSCLVRGVADGGIQSGGSSESFGGMYENIDYARMWVPSNVRITKRDRITNIRSRRGGEVIWADEDLEGGLTPVIFNVNGVVPLFDPFNKHIETFVSLERAE